MKLLDIVKPKKNSTKYSEICEKLTRRCTTAARVGLLAHCFDFKYFYAGLASPPLPDFCFHDKDFTLLGAVEFSHDSTILAKRRGKDGVITSLLMQMFYVLPKYSGFLPSPSAYRGK